MSIQKWRYLQEDLANLANQEIENLVILLHVGESNNYIWQFQKKKAKNQPNSPKIFMIS
jgi:hypothetical protein